MLHKYQKKKFIGYFSYVGIDFFQKLLHYDFRNKD